MVSTSHSFIPGKAVTPIRVLAGTYRCDAVIETLENEAGSLGADALIDVTLTTLPGTMHYCFATANAVQFIEE